MYIQRENQRLKNELNQLQKAKEDASNEIAILKNKLSQLQTDNDKLKQQNNKLLDDQKENVLLIKELNDKIKKLNLKPLDYTKWKEWDTQQVYRFIMNIYDDNTLDEYKNDIYEEVIDGEYTGQDLSGLGLSDMKTLGIKKMSHRQYVFNAIKLLKSNQYNKNNKNNNDNNVNDIEGVNAPTAYL